MLLVEGMGRAALVVVLSVAAWAAFLRGLAPSTFWDTPSFTDYAAALAHGRLPPVGLRLPGYPVFILLAGGRGLDLDRIVAAQLLLGVVANLMVFEVVRRLARSALAGLAAALVVLTFADLLFMGITVYSEPLCLFLVDAAALATVLSFQQGRRRWILGAAALWTGLPWSVRSSSWRPASTSAWPRSPPPGPGSTGAPWRWPAARWRRWCWGSPA